MKCTDWFIDSDTHITEPPDVWTSRLPAKFRDAAPRMIRRDDGIDVWRFGNTERQIPVGATAVAGWHEPFPSFPKNLDECPPAAYDARARLEALERPSAVEGTKLRSIVDRIRPSLEPLLETEARNDPDTLARKAVRANIRAAANHLRHGSQLLERLVQADELVVVGAEYALETGVVDFFDGAPKPDKTG